jgi:hypothetical protein
LHSQPWPVVPLLKGLQCRLHNYLHFQEFGDGQATDCVIFLISSEESQLFPSAVAAAFPVASSLPFVLMYQNHGMCMLGADDLENDGANAMFVYQFAIVTSNTE